MKLTFFSNYYSHHQRPLCESWDRLTDHQFTFVSTEEFSEERRRMGWVEESDVPFEVRLDSNGNLPFSLEEQDRVILGNAPMSLVENRLKQKKTVFKYSERVFKHGYSYAKWIPRLFTYWKNYGRYKSLYLLSAGAYVSADFAMHGTFLGKSYKWGYFPESKGYDLQALMSQKDRRKILWCGRFLDWKHPEAALEAARRLKAEGVAFQLDIIGTGELEDELKHRIQTEDLGDCVHMLGSMTPDEVRTHMEQAGIFLFTSDFNEGWGAVLNESMNSGCAVVASHAIGSVPFLLKHGENGLVYKNGDTDDLYRKVKALLDQPERQKQLGERAYYTIADLWNAEVAARRFLDLAREIADHGFCDLFEDGPCSPAPVMKNDWFHEVDYDIAWIKA